MNRSLALRRLCWKEFRQLLPLILMLSVMGLVLQVLFSLDRSSELDWTKYTFFLGLPGLFAAGVGALLVGQEKDQRTLYWLAALPVPKQDLIRVKYFMGLAGLITVWVISFLLFLLAVSIDRPSSSSEFNEHGQDLIYWVFHSIFLFTLSFATAWYFRSTFVGLLVIVALAALFPLATSIASSLTDHRPFLNAVAFPSDWIVVSTLILFTGLAIVWGWFAANRALSPMPAPARSKDRTDGVSFFDMSIVNRRAIQSPSSALIWQFVAQNRAVLVGLGILLTIALFFVTISNTGGNGEPPPLQVLGGSLAYFAVCGLGVIAFQGDNQLQRIRFLADRGVSPRRVWVTRHVVPIGMMILGIFALALCVTGSLLSHTFQSGTRVSMITLVFFSAGMGCVVYATAQWIGQVVRSSVVASVIAPIAGLIPFAYASFVFDTLEPPIWILVLATVIPFIATYRMTQSWMDYRSGVRYWGSHLGWLALAAILPTIPFMIDYLTYPSVPSSELAAFRKEALAIGYERRSLNELRLLDLHRVIPQAMWNNVPGGIGAGLEEGTPGDANATAEPGQTGAIGIEGAAAMQDFGGGSSFGHETIQNDLEGIATLEQAANRTWAQEREWQLTFIEKQLDQLKNSSPTAAVDGTMVASNLMGDASLVRIQMDDDVATPELRSRYRRTILVMLRICQELRGIKSLKKQDRADNIEIWLVNELRSAGAKERLGEELYQDAIRQLSDQSGRKQARFRAIASDWLKAMTYDYRYSSQFGDYKLPTQGRRTRLLSRRQLSTIAWRLKKYLEAPDDMSRKSAREELAREWKVSPSQFGSSKSLISVGLGSLDDVPGLMWHGEWEKQSESFAK